MGNKVNSKYIALKYGLKTENVRAAVDKTLRSLIPISKEIEVVANGKKRSVKVTRTGVGFIMTKNGNFYEFEFDVGDKWKRYSVLFPGTVDRNFMPVLKRAGSCLVRLDSGCETSQVTGDITCECKEQLEKSMKTIAENGEGFVIRMPLQEGKGTGVNNKLAAHLLENTLGISNVEAAMLLSGGDKIDLRTYYGAISVLKFMGIKPGSTIRLMTNNPRKLVEFNENGYKIIRVQLRIAPNRFTRIHLKAKQEYLGHIGIA